jgi:hypothetical protein
MEARTREERIALNEVAFRAANDALRDRFPSPDDRDLDPYPFLCECGDRRCTRVVEVPLEVYEETRDHPARFVLLPGHEQLHAESVVDEGDGFQIVEKRGVAGDIARSHWARHAAKRR